MSEKIALLGFSRVKFFPIVKNTTEEYSVGEGFSVKEAIEMTREADVSEQKIYADDALYLNMKSWNGINATITLAEMSLEDISKLGFGEYDEIKKVLKVNPQGSNKEYGVTFRCQMANGQYRMYKMFAFTLNEIKESNTKTKGSSTEVNNYQLIGTFTSRKVDDYPYEMHDGDDLNWLDLIETLPKI